MVPYPVGKAAASGSALNSILGVLNENGFEYEISPFLSVEAWDVLYRKGFLFKKIAAIAKGYFSRLSDLGHINRYDIIFIHRECKSLWISCY
jgi:hypothetical protein